MTRKPSDRLLEVDPAAFEPVTFAEFVSPLVENVPKAKVTRVCKGLRTLNNMYLKQLKPGQNRAEKLLSGEGMQLHREIEHPFLLHSKGDYSESSPVFRHVFSNVDPDRISLLAGILYQIAEADKLTDAARVGDQTANYVVVLLNKQITRRPIRH